MLFVLARRHRSAVTQLAMLAILGVASPVRAEPLPHPGCPLRFDGESVGWSSTCLFVGRYNDSCGGNAVAVFASDGHAMVVGVAVSETSPVVYLPGEVRSSTHGKIVRWHPDLEIAKAAEEGTAVLEEMV
jgi:hypothetical protein